MIFRCKNCGANAIYSPEKGTMYCPYCDSLDSEELAPSEGMGNCINCGGELEAGDHNSAVKCSHCGSYVIFEERTSGEYQPHTIMPFKISKDNAKELIRKEFGKKAFLPTGFLSEAKMSEMEGHYVPFFMYDYECNYKLSAKGTKIRTWRVGNTEYTETSIYDIYRDMDVNFDKIPADASIEMNDEKMDLMEPYDYKALEEFKAKYMSGFLAEKYNMPAEELEPRANRKAQADAQALMTTSIKGYASVTDKVPNLKMNLRSTDYTLLPVWKYSFFYKNKEYPFFINGQTGKMVGNAPFAIEKVVTYGLTVFSAFALIGMCINIILGGL